MALFLVVETWLGLDLGRVIPRTLEAAEYRLLCYYL